MSMSNINRIPSGDSQSSTSSSNSSSSMSGEIPRTCSPPTEAAQIESNLQSRIIQKAGSVLRYMSENPITSLVKGVPILLGSAVLGSTVLAHGAFIMTCYIPAGILAGVGAGVGYAIDRCRGLTGNPDDPHAALKAGFQTGLSVGKFVGNLIIANPLVWWVRCNVHIVSVIGLDLLEAGGGLDSDGKEHKEILHYLQNLLNVGSLDLYGLSQDY